MDFALDILAILATTLSTLNEATLIINYWKSTDGISSKSYKIFASTGDLPI